MEGTFMDLLNDDVCNDPEQMSSGPCLSQKKGRAKNFSIQEDMLLISAWENISLDSIKGNNQTQNSYWSRIATYFDEHKSFATERTPAALSNRWSTIQKCVSKFQGFYSQIEGRNQSGICEADKVRQATELYQSLQGSAFPFLHCWTELRNSPKFTSNVSKKRVRGSINDNLHHVGSSQSPVNVECGRDIEEGLERPIGRKTAKKLKRMADETRKDASTAFFTEMREHISTNAIKRREEYEKMVELEEEHIELKRKQVLINESKEKREQQLYESSIMAIDVTKMEPQLANFYNSLKAEIIEKRRLF